MNKKVRVTRDIHNFVRGHLSWEESLRLLEEIVESKEWLQILDIEMLIYEMVREKQDFEVA